MSETEEHEYELGHLDVDLDVAERHTGSDDNKAERRWMIWGAVGAVVVTAGFLGALALGSHHDDLRRAKPAVGAASRVTSALAAHAAVLAEPEVVPVLAAAKPKAVRSKTPTKPAAPAATPTAAPVAAASAAAPSSPVASETSAAPAAAKDAAPSKKASAGSVDPLSGLPNVADVPDEDVEPAEAAEEPTDFTHDDNPFADDAEDEGDDADPDPDDADDDTDEEDVPEPAATAPQTPSAATPQTPSESPAAEQF